MFYFTRLQIALLEQLLEKEGDTDVQQLYA